MEIKAIRLGLMKPPQDDLFSKIKASGLRLKDGDIVAVASKVVSIHEGRSVATKSAVKDDLAKHEAQYYLPRKKDKGFQPLFTITHNTLLGVAGIDESNADGHYVLYPSDPMRSAHRLLRWLKKEYKVAKLGVLITDSHSTPLRRGAMGFALAWAGIDPLNDYRGAKDLFAREMKIEMSNQADALAAAAVLIMGEGSEQTPIALIRNAPAKVWRGRHTKGRWNEFIVPLKEDLFAPFLTKVKWKKGGAR